MSDYLYKIMRKGNTEKVTEEPMIGKWYAEMFFEYDEYHGHYERAERIGEYVGNGRFIDDHFPETDDFTMSGDYLHEQY